MSVSGLNSATKPLLLIASRSPRMSLSTTYSSQSTFIYNHFVLLFFELGSLKYLRNRFRIWSSLSGVLSWCAMQRYQCQRHFPHVSFFFSRLWFSISLTRIFSIFLLLYVEEPTGRQPMNVRTLTSQAMPSRYLAPVRLRRRRTTAGSNTSNVYPKLFEIF